MAFPSEMKAQAVALLILGHSCRRVQTELSEQFHGAAIPHYTTIARWLQSLAEPHGRAAEAYWWALAVAFSRLSTSVTAAFSGGNLNRSLISHGLLICRRPPHAALRWSATVCLHSFSRAVANGAGRPLTKTGPIAISFVTTIHLPNFGSTAGMIRPDEPNRASDPRVSSRFRLSRPPGISQFASRSLRPLSAGCFRCGER